MSAIKKEWPILLWLAVVLAVMAGIFNLAIVPGWGISGEWGKTTNIDNRGGFVPGVTNFSGPLVLSSPQNLSGASVSMGRHTELTVKAGATIYSSGTTATVYFYGPVQAENIPWIDSSSVSAYFLPGSAQEINVCWWDANGNDTNDDTAAFNAAFRALVPSSTVKDGYYIYSLAPLIIPTGHYYLSSGVTPAQASMTVLGKEHSIIEQLTPTEDILDWAYGYNVEVRDLTLIGGRRQIAYSNPNLGPAELKIQNVKFINNNSDAALKFYLPHGTVNLSVVATLSGCLFKDVYQCVETVPGVSFRFQDGWVFSGVTNTNRALFVNKNEMILDRMYGVPNGIITPTGGRWIDNYLDLVVTHSRFGSEGSGMPIVYNYATELPRTDYVGGGKIDIKNSALGCGDFTIDNTIIRLMTGIPQRITIRDNDWVSKSGATAFIAIDPSFDIVTYINALSANDYIFIDVANNASFVPLEYLGLPDALVATDAKKVRVSEDFRPYIYGGPRNSLLHFDGTTSGVTVIDEFFNAWSSSGVSLLESDKRFGSACMRFDGGNGYIVCNNYLSLDSAFTAEGWFYSGCTTEPYQTIFQAMFGGGYGISLYYNGTPAAMELYISADGASWDVANAVNGAKTSWVNNTWYKWALEYNGTEYALYIGEAGSTVTKDISVLSGSTPCAINAIRLGGNAAGGGLSGGMDEFRLTIGRYRYGAPFVPEAQAFRVE